LVLDGGGSTALFASGEYERPVQEAISSLIKPCDVFYDIGANIGFFSVLAGRLTGSAGRVFAFEPVPENASLIERNRRLNHLNNIEILRMAASLHSGKSELLLAHCAGGAVLKSAGTPPDQSGSMVVETRSIDALVQRREIQPPDIVKIDVEGAEMNVLLGMAEVLDQWGPKIIIEVDDADKTRCQEKLRACIEFLETFGYRSEVLPNSYPDGHWFVRHLVGMRED
jgi:FkbM family methyltransferase